MGHLKSRLLVKMVDMSSYLRIQNNIIDTRKNEMFVIIDSLFNERIDYGIELLNYCLCFVQG